MESGSCNGGDTEALCVTKAHALYKVVHERHIELQATQRCVSTC
jgi:hypothetical protein